MRRLRSQLVLAAAVVSAGVAAHAATLSWDPSGGVTTPSGGTGSWDLSTLDWSNGAADVAWTDATATGVDTAVFGGTAGTVTLNTNLTALGLQFNSSGYTVAGSGTLTLGAGGITSAGNAAISSNLAIAPGMQNWNVAAGQNLSLTGTVTRSPGGAVIVQGGAGTVATSTLSNTNGIVGPWMLVNNAGNYSFATVSSGNITAYTGATLITVNTGAWGNIPSGGSGTVNYDINSGGNFAVTGLNRNVNTIRYLGTGATQISNSGSANNSLMTLNGLVNDGTGTFVIGVTGTPSTGYLDLVIGANNDLVLGAMTANITLNNFIKDGTGAGSVTILGGNGPSNVVTINGANTYTGATNIDSGRLVITNAAGLSASSGTFVRLGGTLDVQGNLTSGGTAGVSLAGTGTGGMGALISSTNGSLGGNVLLARNSALGGPGNLTLSGVVSGTANLTKVGAGSLTLSGVNTYTGGTNISGGQLVLSGSGSINTTSGISLTNGGGIVQNSGTPVSVTVTASNGTVDGTGTLNSVLVPAAGALGNINPASSVSIGNLTLQGGSTLNFTTSATSPLFNVGNLSAAGSGIIINATNPSWNAGVYDLIGYSSLSGSLANFTKGTVSGLTVRQSATLSNPGGFIALTITGDNPIWTGAQNGNWTVAAIAGSKNWKLITAGTPTDYIQGDTVRFDDSASGTTDITISDANVSPAQMLFANAGRTYTVSGPFGIVGNGSMSITGGGTVILKSQNTYSGGTTLAAGTLGINNSSAIGTGRLSIGAGTTLDNTSGAAVSLSTNNAQTWNGNFTFNGSSDLNLGTGNVTLTAAPTITTNNSANLTVGGNISGTFGLTKLGTGTLVLSGNNTYSGTTIISQGTLQVAGGVTGTLSTSANSDIQISPGASDSGTLLVTGGVLNANRMIIGGDTGNTSGSAGVLVQSGGTINSQQWFTVGSGNAAGNTFPTGEYDLSGGTMNLLSQQMEIANFFGTTGTVNMTGGNINLENNSSIALGANNLASDGTFNQSGGNVTFYSNAGPTVGGTGILYLGKANSLAGNYTYNLNGGVLTVPQIQQTAGSGGNGIFNFNGGTLRAAKANANFMTGLTQANVGTGGAIIDDNGFAITIAQSLASNAFPDGGLTKLGAGTLTLTGSSSYNGPTTISAGTLLLSGSGSINSSSGIAVNGGKLVQISSSGISPTVTVSNGTVSGSNATINTVVMNSSSNAVIANGNGDTGVLAIGTLTFNGNAIANITLAGPTATTAPGIVTGSLVTSGGSGTSTGHITINAANSLWNTGVYDLIGYSSISGVGFNDFQLGTVSGLSPRQMANLTNVSGDIALTISGGNIPVWTGALNGNWTTATLDAPKNWKLQTGGAPTDFLTGDTVLFDDTAGGTTNVNISDANVSPISTTFNNSALDYTISSTGGFGIASGFLEKNGSHAVTITTANSYAGGTTLNAGALNVNNAAALGTGTITLNGGTLGNTSGAAIVLTTNNPVAVKGDFSFAGPNDLSLGTGAVTVTGDRTITSTTGTLTMGAVTGDGNLTKAGDGNLSVAGGTIAGVLNVTGGKFQISQDFHANGGLTGSGTIEDPTTADKWFFVTNPTDQTFSGVIQGGLSKLGLNKSGNGTLTLTGANQIDDAVTVNAGTLVYSGNHNNTTQVDAVGTTAATNAVLVLPAGVTFAANDNTGQQYSSSLAISTNATSFGRVKNTGATLTVNRQLAVGGTGYGAFTQTAGNTTVGGFIAVGGNAAGGVVNLSGGSLNMTGNSMTIGYAASSPGLLNVGGNATMTMGTTANGYGLGIWVGEVGSGVVNLSGNGNISIPADSITIANGTTNGGNRTVSGVVNLDGGTLATNSVIASPGSGASTSLLNFNGGTLAANMDSTSFIRNATTGTGTFNVFVYGGGATIDDGGHNVTISQPLQAPTGGGVSATGLAVSGSGYIDTPIVTVSGGDGTGATAVATIDAGGNLTGITITNPGTGYTVAPSFTLVGGGANASGSISGTATLVTNVSGGLTKTGTGVLTLSAANTYTGATNVNAGTLALDATGSIASTAVNVAANATLSVASGGNMPSTAAVTNNGTVNFNNPTRTIASLNGTAPGAVVNLNGTSLTVSGGGTYAGAINDSGTNGALTVAAALSVGSFNVATVNANANLKIHGTSKTSALNLTGGSGAWTSGLDLTTSKFILQSSVSNKTADMTRVRDQVTFGK
ncbi:MAG: autotransporter-associated beta strand repeat-containing protein, partial [Phycisphaerae bacterium]